MSLTYTPRSFWGAGANGRADRGRLDIRALVGITVHWPGGGLNLTALPVDSVAAQLRAWQAQHRRQHWSDIGYNFLGDGDGNVWEGSGMFRGAHAGVMRGNQTTIGYQFITGTNEGPTDLQIAAFRNFRAELLDLNSDATAVFGHSDWTNTGCPGDPIRDLIRRGALTSTAIATAPAVPKPKPIVPTLEEDMPIIIVERPDKQLARGLYDPLVGKIKRELSPVEHKVLARASSVSPEQVVVVGVSDADYKALGGK